MVWEEKCDFQLVFGLSYEVHRDGSRSGQPKGNGELRNGLGMQEFIA
jgi:hypothetical protein